jgi:demethylmenaquinone methyltransferase/2-methoxy-6-polyprenyl-1,4-benzoquinol methylase
VPFRASFDCLWCGTAHTCRSADDIEGWAQLCPACVGKAGDNGFLRFRLRQALTERGAAARASGAATENATDQASDAADIEPDAGTVAAARAPAYDGRPVGVGRAAEAAGLATAAEAADVSHEGVADAARPAARDDDLVAYYEARAPEYDDWYLRRGRYARGPVHDTAWNAELDAAGRWLDAQPIHGEIVELAAGTGWWSPLLASKGELSIYDASPSALDRARERLVAHGLRAHIHVRDAWAEGDRHVDAVFAGFWLSHIPRDHLEAFLGVVRRWLKPGGTFAFIDSLEDPQSSASDHPAPADDRSVRRLNDGREFTIVKVYYQPAELESALAGAGFTNPTVTTTGRFFLTGVATAQGT